MDLMEALTSTNLSSGGSMPLPISEDSESHGGCISSPDEPDHSSTSSPHSVFGNSSTTGTSFTNGNGKNVIPDDILAAKETRAVNCSRAVVLLVLVIFASVAGVLTYLFATESEQADFEIQVSEITRPEWHLP